MKFKTPCHCTIVTADQDGDYVCPSCGLVYQNTGMTAVKKQKPEPEPRKAVDKPKDDSAELDKALEKLADKNKPVEPVQKAVDVPSTKTDDLKASKKASEKLAEDAAKLDKALEKLADEDAKRVEESPTTTGWQASHVETDDQREVFDKSPNADRVLTEDSSGIETWQSGKL